MKRSTNRTIGERIALGSAILCLLIAGLSVFAITRLLSIRKLSDSVAFDSLPGVTYAGRINVIQAENQIRVNRLLQARTEADRKIIREEMRVNSAEITESFKKYEASIFAAEDRRIFEDFKQVREKFVAARERYFSMVETNREAAPILAPWAASRAPRGISASPHRAHPCAC